MSSLRILWIDDIGLEFNESIRGKICQYLGVESVICVECSIEDIDQHQFIEFDCIITTVNGQQKIQNVYDKIRQKEIMHVIDTVEVKDDSYDWQILPSVFPPYGGIRNLSLAGYPIPLQKSGKIINTK